MEENKKDKSSKIPHGENIEDKVEAQVRAMMYIKDKILSFIYTILVTGVSILVLMLTWNYVIPYLFSLPTINIFQAGALYILSMLLFKYK